MHEEKEDLQPPKPRRVIRPVRENAESRTTTKVPAPKPRPPGVRSSKPGGTCPAPRASPILRHFSRQGPLLRGQQHFERSPSSDVIRTAPGALVYVIGDLEGRLNLLVSWLLSIHLIRIVPGPAPPASTEIVWTGGTNTWVIQCGDQIDNRGRIERHAELDLSVVLFMEYLQHVSNGQVRSIIGNHEYMNYFGKFKYVHENNAAALLALRLDRQRLMKESFAPILRRRHVMLRINNAVFTHAGVTPRAVRAFKELFNMSTTDMVDIDEFISLVNRTILNEGSEHCRGQVCSRKLFDSVVYKHLLWNREYNQESRLTAREPFSQFACSATSSLPNLNILGHNKQKDNRIKVFRYAANENELISTTTEKHVRTQLHRDQAYFALTDASTADREQEHLPYLVLWSSNPYSAHFDQCLTKQYSCSAGGACPYFSALAILAHCVNDVSEDAAWATARDIQSTVMTLQNGGKLKRPKRKKKKKTTAKNTNGKTK